MHIELWEDYTENEFERKFHEEKYIKLSNDINFINSQIHHPDIKHIEYIDKTIGIKGKVLDLAGGSGFITGAISKLKNVDEVTMVEISSSSLKHLVPKVIEKMNGNKNKIKLIQGSFYNIKLENYFDFVFIFGALHHASNLRLCTNNINKCLKTNGYMISREPTAHIYTPNQMYINDLKRITCKETGIIRIDHFYRLTEYLTAFTQSNLELINSLEVKINNRQKKSIFNLDLKLCETLYDYLNTFLYICKKKSNISSCDECKIERW